MKLSRELHSQLEIFFREFFEDENLRLPEIEIFCNRGARFVTKLISVHGITFRRFIFIKPDLICRNPELKLCISRNLLAHEATHVMQYQKLGTLKFLYRYFKSYFLNLKRSKDRNFNSRMQAYLDIPFEREARAGGTDFVEWLNKQRA
jgi:hypothetical protein